VKFSEIQPVLEDGKRARRRHWDSKFPGSWLVIVTPGPLPDGSRFDQAFFYWNAEDKLLRPWIPAWDLMADDWYILPDE
jgi:hypothetical protein